MTNTPHTSDELYKPFDSEFLVKFRKLKQLRNTHQIDEPDFDEQVEQLAADIYTHPTRDGWCCACDADIAFAMQEIQKEPEFEALIARECVRARQAEIQYLLDDVLTKESIKPSFATRQRLKARLRELTDAAAEQEPPHAGE